MFRRQVPLSFLNDAGGKLDYQAPAVFASGPGQLLVELPQPGVSEAGVAAFIEVLESFELLGVRRFRRLSDGVIVDYDVDSLELKDLHSLFMAAFSRVSYAPGDSPGSTHVLPVTFGGSAGPDMSMASVLLDTAEPLLVRRVCRSKHIVRSFSSPGASALIEVPWAEAWQSHVQPGRAIKAVPAGSLTISSLGVTLISRSCFTNDYVVGRVNMDLLKVLPEIRIGDAVWLRSGKWSQPNDR